MGSIGRPHGLNGEVGVYWEGEAPIPVGDVVFIGPGRESLQPYDILSARIHKGFPLVSFAGIEDRNSAEALRGEKIFLPRSSLPAPAEDEAWLEDLVGSEILLEDGTRIGRLDHLEFPAGQEIWAIKNDRGQEILFPARPEFIASIDAQAGTVRIAPPSGLLDIYLA